MVHDRAAVEAELQIALAKLERLRAEVEALKAAVVKLSAPAPSTQPPWVKENDRKSRRKTPGAREGHEPHHREQKLVDEEKDATLASCPECDIRLGDAIEVRDRRVEELVPARLKVTLYHVHRYW